MENRRQSPWVEAEAGRLIRSARVPAAAKAGMDDPLALGNVRDGRPMSEAH